MPGPAAKDSSTRARRNKTSTKATLVADAAIVAPELPGADWHPMTLEWWRDLWASPMAPEYDESDRHGLFMYARMVDDFWCAETAKDRRETLVRIEAMWKSFGTVPLARRSLQWEIQRAEDAKAKGAKRAAAKATEPKGDPRAILRSV